VFALQHGDDFFGEQKLHHRARAALQHGGGQLIESGIKAERQHCENSIGMRDMKVV
jgi:hypothetical protein